MPELPEVETTLRGIAPSALGRRIDRVVVRERRLRWPIDGGLPEQVAGQTVRGARRRAKYLILDLDRGALLLHLGMSGRLRVVARDTPPGLHDHLDIVLDGGAVLRLTDPRRFGSLHYTPGDPLAHPLLASSGPEPLSDAFTAERLYALTRGRRTGIKALLMDARVVAGVGNIYANEALFRAGVDPRRAAGRIALARYRDLVAAVRATLSEAIEAGGSTLRDWLHADGAAGYFQQTYFVYGRGGEPCRRCGNPVRESRQGQRATYHCRVCQR